MDTRRTFHKGLEEIRDDLVRLAALVCEAIARGTAALLDGDLVAAQAIIDGDEALNRIAIDVEDRCYHQLALQQPMASDLRALVTAVRLTSELERSGDLMVNVAKGTERIAGQEIDPKTRGLIQAMSDEALRLFRFATEAYAEADEAKATALDLMDDTPRQHPPRLHRPGARGVPGGSARHPGGGAAGAHRSVLRADRRPRREHRRQGPLPRERVDARARPRSSRGTPVTVGAGPTLAEVVEIQSEVLVGIGIAAGVVVVLALLVRWRLRRNLARRIAQASLRLEEEAGRDERGVEKNLRRLERAVDRAVLVAHDTSASESRLLRALEAIPQGVVLADDTGEVVLPQQGGRHLRIGPPQRSPRGGGHRRAAGHGPRRRRPTGAPSTSSVPLAAPSPSAGSPSTTTGAPSAPSSSSTTSPSVGGSKPCAATSSPTSATS